MFRKSWGQLPALWRTIWCEQAWSVKPNEGNPETRDEKITPVAFAEMSKKGLAFLATFLSSLVSFQQWVFQKLCVTKAKKEGIIFIMGKFSNNYGWQPPSLIFRSGEKLRAGEGLTFSIPGRSHYQHKSEKWVTQHQGMSFSSMQKELVMVRS